MEFDPKQFDDEQLDAMLRDVTVPADLKAELREIPTATRVELNKQQNSRAASMPWFMFLAASLLAIAAFFTTQSLLNDRPNHDVATNEQPKLDSQKPKLIANQPEIHADSAAFEDIDRQMESLTAMINGIKLQKLQQQLEQHENQSRFQLEQREMTSMIFALSDQTPLSLGGDSTGIKSDMARVIQRFPGTRGAEIAQTYLNQN